jgi:hypothetical protein
MEIIQNLPIETYHNFPHVSNTGLGYLEKSAAHYNELVTNGSVDSPAFREGRMIHALLLEPSVFYNAYAVYPGDDRRKKEYKEFAATYADKEIVMQGEYDAALAMVRSMRATKMGQYLLNEGQAELTLLWEDPETGADCRCRFDYLRDNGIGIDFKTTGSHASPDEFMRTAARYAYHRQAAFYSDGYKACYQKELRSFVFAVVEKKPPYAVGFYSLEASALEEGRSRYQKSLYIYQTEYVGATSFKAYQDAVVEISLPPWAYQERD